MRERKGWKGAKPLFSHAPNSVMFSEAQKRFVFHPFFYEWFQGRKFMEFATLEFKWFGSLIENFNREKKDQSKKDQNKIIFSSFFSLFLLFFKTFFLYFFYFLFIFFSFVLIFFFYFFLLLRHILFFFLVFWVFVVGWRFGNSFLKIYIKSSSIKQNLDIPIVFLFIFLNKFKTFRWHFPKSFDVFIFVTKTEKEKRNIWKREQWNYEKSPQQFWK